MNGKGSQETQQLKESLLAEYQRQAQGTTSLLNDADLDDDQVRRIEELQQREQRGRYVDIVNVHAAAQNASVVNERTYRSHEDSMVDANRVGDDDDLMDQYGLIPRQNDNKGDNDGDFFSQNGDQAPLSEAGHYQQEVKRSNFIQLFLDEYNADQFVATHLYGAINNLSIDVPKEEIEDVLGTSAENLNASFVQRLHRYDRQREQVKRLTPFETYIALIKGYSVLSLLLIPKAFNNGGYGISGIFLTTSGILSMVACLKLIEAGLATNIYSYPLVVERVLGKKSRFFLEFAIAMTQFSFAISHITFLVESFKSTIDILCDTDSKVIVYAVIVFVIYSLLSWVRNLAKFSFTFLAGNFLIIVAIIYVTIYAGQQMVVQGGPGPDVEFINPSGVLNTLGFTFYCYEGIGIVMPVMATAEKPETFKKMLIYALCTLIVVYVAFGEVCYWTWGSDLNEPIVTQMLPSDNVMVILIKFLYSINLICSYPIVINPCNTAIENWLCSCLKQQKTRLYWAQNFSRCLVTIAAILCAIVLASKIDKFLGLIGSFLCAPLALTFPALIHIKLLAKTPTEKFIDGVLIAISVGVFFFCSVQTILAWNENGAKNAD